MRKMISTIIIMLILQGVCIQTSGQEINSVSLSGESRNTDDASQQTENADSAKGLQLSGQSSLEVSAKVPSFFEYQKQYSQAASPDETISIDAADYYEATGDTIPRIEAIDGVNSLMTADIGSVSWKFDVRAEGLYDINFTYYPVEGKGTTIERILYLDGKLPYSEARDIIFLRIWENEGEKLFSTKGNEFRRTQKEIPSWQTIQMISNATYNDSGLKLYLTAGSHVLTLEAVSEPLAISSIKLCQNDLPLSYKEVLTQYQQEGYSEYPAAKQPIVVQGEDAVYKSNNTLYAVEDRTSCITDPYDVSKIQLNCIGGNNWKYKHQWIEWEAEVTEGGLYQLAFRSLQDFVSGANASRRLTVDGNLPFAEARNIPISYSMNWQMTVFGEKGEPYLLYLSPGRHMIRLTVTMGEISGILEDVNNCIIELNQLYRNILTITGTIPDSYRDYKLEKNIPDMISIFKSCSERLANDSKALTSISNAKGEQSVAIDRLVVQLDSLCDRTKTIPTRLSELNENINSLAVWMVSGSEVGLLVDKLFLMSPSSEPMKAEASFMVSLWSSVTAFFKSFFNDYYSLDSYAGLSGEKKGEVTLWLAGGSGRDQAMVIKNISDFNFTSKTGIQMNIRLVDMDALLRAVASSSGPDVAIFQGQSQALNYGIRGAAYDLNKMSDIAEIKERFAASAILPLEYDGKLYGLPEQQSFPMMFYRTDIFEELGISYPDTWKELYEIIPVLSEKNFSLGLPTPATIQSGSSSSGLNPIFSALLLQSGASVYNADGSRCTLNSLKAIDAFITWTEFYTKYNLPKSYSAINRFRTGEMPLIITDYTFYNSLVLVTPEIQGLWTMVPIPGIKQDDLTIRRDVASTVSCAMMFNNARDIGSSWEFLKWWTSYEGQMLYGQEIEALQGPSARWPTANLEAMNALAWPTKISEQIQTQWQSVKGIPEVPGGYYLGRNVDNAIKSVINVQRISQKTISSINIPKSPREVILDAVDSINEEMIIKRKEFGLE